METIELRDVLRTMDLGQSFSFVVVKFDKNRKRGGKLFECIEGRATRNKVIKRKLNRSTTTKRQNHFEHLTRNIEILIDGKPTQTIRKIHLPLIIRFNNKKVVL